MKHGASTYVHRRCRCDICTAGNRDKQWRQNLTRRERTAANGGIAPVDPHGSARTYVNWGCRCRPCVEANSAACAAYRKARAARTTTAAVSR